MDYLVPIRCEKIQEVRCFVNHASFAEQRATISLVAPRRKRSSDKLGPTSRINRPIQRSKNKSEDFPAFRAKSLAIAHSGNADPCPQYQAIPER
jgi:hypothetical protein